ncbi:MAG TPA: hypothetical protein VN671_07870 [Solirubrobacterales bacterium]|nr:hypothetical protein [Solirubrobacterales bacterium]
MTKTELESKHLADLHQLAAAAGVERYRMLTCAELIERLSDGDEGDSASRAASNGDKDRSERPRSRRRRSGSGSGSRSGGGREREERLDVEEEEEVTPPRRERSSRSAAPASRDAEGSGDEKDSDDDSEGERPRRRRRRRRPFGRRREGISIQDLLLPAESGRQAVLLAETREGATDLLRSVAADLAGSDGPDPVALLIDPSPEELADWKREAPQAELVSAGQARHANDALASAQRRASEGEDVILLVDSLTRFTESFGDTDAAKELFDAGRAGKATGKGSLTVVVALERS